MRVVREFRDFAVKGNVVDMAVGIIIGGAFGKIVSSLVNDVIMPPIGLLLGGVDFKGLFFDLSRGDYPTLEAAKAAGAPILAYGQFLQTTVDFIIIAFAVFLMVKAITVAKRKESVAPTAPPPPTPEDVLLLREIRDALKKG